jgi:hypothetical protein
MSKKAQGLSINTIIIAIIVLVVLVVLVMVFTGYFSGWTSTVGSCETQGGDCVDSRAACSEMNGRTIRATCASEEEVCCVAGRVTEPKCGEAANTGCSKPEKGDDANGDGDFEDPGDTPPKSATQVCRDDGGAPVSLKGCSSDEVCCGY